jgi:hypothetical protein
MGTCAVVIGKTKLHGIKKTQSLEVTKRPKGKGKEVEGGQLQHCAFPLNIEAHNLQE